MLVFNIIAVTFPYQITIIKIKILPHLIIILTGMQNKALVCIFKETKSATAIAFIIGVMG